MWSPLSTLDLWEKKFCMSKEESIELCDLLRPFIMPNALSPNDRALSTEKKLALTLYFLKDSGSITMTANTFGIHQSTVSEIIVEICNAVANSSSMCRLSVIYFTDIDCGWPGSCRDAKVYANSS